MADNCRDFQNLKSMDVYILEKHKEIFARDVIMLDIVNNYSESFRERVELFFDIYWNCFIRQKTADYINSKIKDLENLVTDTHKSKIIIKSLFDFKELKYKDRDDLVDIFGSWNTKVPFNMEGTRDQRLRYHYKERYDYRANLIDWDYVWNLKEDASIIHYREYKDWRQTGTAFETRFSSYIISNRTMGSYIQGNLKTSGVKCMVRGFWGDILTGPFWGFGIETDYEPEKTRLFKTRNLQHEWLSMHVAEYNIHYITCMLEKLEEHHHDFDKYADRGELLKQQEKDAAEKKKLEAIEEGKEEEEEEDEEKEKEKVKEKEEEKDEKKDEEKEK